MKLRNALVVTLLSPLLSLSSHAFMRAPINLPTDKVDCGNRSNSMSGQMDDLQSLLHKVALVGEESGREVSYDPNTDEARNAEVLGQSVTCGGNSGALNLVEYKGKTVLIGAAHAFYKDGNLKCNEGSGTFYPDDHYYPNPESGIQFNRGYQFKLPPLNHERSYKGLPIGVNSSENLKDFVILEIEDQSLLERQLGGKRPTIIMEDIPTSDLNTLSNRQDLTLVSSRKNFYEKYKVSYESGCQVLRSLDNERLKKHTCDTGQGSSGSSLNFEDRNGQLKSIGIHYGSAGNENYFIPSENIIKELERIFPANTNPMQATVPTSI